MVGDRIETDIAGGINAGLGATVWLKINDSSKCTIKPTYTITNIDQLPQILNLIEKDSNNKR